MSHDVVERTVVEVPAEQVYAAVADVRRLARWSPECFAVWIYRRRSGRPARFVGFNRLGPFVWFKTCVVRVAEPGREFAFDVSTFGLPVARWGYAFAPADGGTEVTEYWTDRRNAGSRTLGRIFTGSSSTRRPEVNAAGMRATLTRLKSELENASSPN